MDETNSFIFLNLREETDRIKGKRRSKQKIKDKSHGLLK